MGKYILFGAGRYGEIAIEFLGNSNIEYFLDNDPYKDNTKIEGISIKYYGKWKEIIDSKQIVVSVSPEREGQILNQLKQDGYDNVIGFQKLKYNIIRERIQNRPDFIRSYHKAIDWIYNNTVDGKAIICNTELRKGYPEVTGYYIPSLLRWGYRDLAISFAKWLCNIQKDNGSWYDTENKHPYIFDSAQILKGLLAIRELLPEVDAHILKGCEWIFSCMREDGRLITPCKDAWGNDTDICDEVIHIYCLSPLIEAARIFDKPEYEEKARHIFVFYKKNYYEKIMNFSLLSHFYAYLMEALLDLGEVDMAREAMSNITKYQKENGAVPAYNNVDWICSTGLYQLALVWFRLGETERGNKAFEYACKLQNESGGWFGSYLSEENSNEVNTYIPTAEISWAVKYFLDALYYKMLSEFEIYSDGFVSSIDKKDGRYIVVKDEINDYYNDINKNIKVLDVGCGKCRYLINLLEDIKYCKYYAVDLSLELMNHILPDGVDKKVGTLTNIPYEDDTFDFVYTCEALEHAVDIESAIREMTRVTKSGGRIMIVDKNADMLGALEIGDWEQWFDDDKLIEMLSRYCSDTKVYKDVDYEGKPSDGLFHAWVGIVI